MKRTRTALTVVVVLIGVLAGASLAIAQTPPTPAPAGSTVNAEPETQKHVVTTGSVIRATVLTAAGAPIANAQVFWTESGPGDLVRADAATDASGEAVAISTSRSAGSQTVTAWLDAPGAACADTPTPVRCDNTAITWTPKQSPNQAALECSGGAFPLMVDPIITPADLAEVPNIEEPCPTMGAVPPSPAADPKVRREVLLDVPADPLVFAGVLEGRSEFTSDHSESTARAAGVEVGGTLGVDVTRTLAGSYCAPNGVATQVLDAGQITITDTNGTPDDPTDDTIVFDGIAPPNTEIPLDPLINITLNEQLPVTGGLVSPELPGEKQNRHAEGTVNSVHIQILTSPVGPPLIDVIVGHAESDITCKQHAWSIDVEPEDQTKVPGTDATVTATVTDEAGRPVQGEDITWTTTGVGSFVFTQTKTDENGQATATATSPDEGDQFITGTVSKTTTKCDITTPKGICSDEVVIHWDNGGPPPPPAALLRMFGHAHTDYDGNGQVHRNKNDRGDVHVAGNVRDDLTDAAPPFGPLGYWDLRADPPGTMQDEFRCERFTIQSMTRTGPVGVNQVTITGLVGRCNKSQRDPNFASFELIVQDNGQNPPNQDAYRMTFFGPGGNIIYQSQNFTTVGLGDLTIQLI